MITVDFSKDARAFIGKFLREGILGDLKIGMDADVVQSLLGLPEEISRERKTHFVLKYKDLQLTFND